MTVERGAVFEDTGPNLRAIPPPLLFKGSSPPWWPLCSWIHYLPCSLSHRVGLGKRPSWGAGH